jgi:hypothetical protein
MKSNVDRVVKLMKSRAPVDIARLKKGDFVFDALSNKWISVEKLVKVGDSVFISGKVSTTNETVKQDSKYCFPSWNPRRKCYGRAKGETRTMFWLP